MKSPKTFTEDDKDELTKKDDLESGSKEKKQEPIVTIAEVFSFGEEKSLYLYGGIFCSLLSGFILPAMLFFFTGAFESLGSSASSEDFLKNIRILGLSFLGLGLFAGLFMTLQVTLMETLSGIMTKDLKKKWFEALLRQDIRYFDVNQSSGEASLISKNGKLFAKGVGRKMGEGIQMTMAFFASMVYAFYSSWKASFVILGVTPVIIVSCVLLVKLTQAQVKVAQETYKEAGSIVYQTVSSIRTVLSLNAASKMISRFQVATKKGYESAQSQCYLLGLVNGSMMGSFLLSYIAVTLYGSYLLYSQVRSEGCDPSNTVPGNTTCDTTGMGVLGALFGITFGASVLPQISVGIESFNGARAACYPALKVMNRKAGENPIDYVIDSSSKEGKTEVEQGEIVFDNVTFSYPTRTEAKVFDGLSLKIPAGKTVALVGPSGGGKSSAVQLIERFYDPTFGKITIDGVDIKQYNVGKLRSAIGYVGQEPTLFASSIEQNILHGHSSCSQQDVEEAAKMANAHDFITSFADGYNTMVGDKGSKMSGGQKQRIAIARALLLKPKILILDEATSALDSESEKVVQDALDHIMANRTTVVIAHRLSTIKNADMIAVLNDGRVVETGTHEELIEAHGAYFDLVQAQNTSSITTLEKSASEGGPSRNSSAVDLHSLENQLLQFENVRFTYPSRLENEIFKGLNFAVGEGETLALVGPSGQGKSTIIQLIERFYDPSKGSISLNGVNLKDYNVHYLREQIGLVSQEPTLFDTSISENIRYGYPDATMEDIQYAAKQANAHDFIASFPNGYDTFVGEGGTQISGGQKQRIAIARAILKKPKILLLDEATSALDSESEQVVQDALDQIMASKNHTIIVIAHRLSTVKNADRIAVIADGKVKEIGTHSQLMEKPNGHYARLVAFQNLGTNDVKLETEKNTLTDSSQTIEDVEEDETHLLESATQHAKENEKRARLFAKDDKLYLFIGVIGATFSGLVFPVWGIVFAYMIQLLYTPVMPCMDEIEICQVYWNETADDMRKLSLSITYGCIGMIASTMVGNTLLYYGFGTATERMNKRIRDLAFTALVRREISYFDKRPVGTITTQMEEDTALMHSFSGQPIRSLVINLSSVFVGLILAFCYMWPFALVTLAILPFMAFGSIMEMKTYYGLDEADEGEEDENSPGGIIAETLVNIRTVAALHIEVERLKKLQKALQLLDPTPLWSNFVKGSMTGLGQLIQMCGMGLMFWFGGFCLVKYPTLYSFHSFLVAMNGLLFGISGIGLAAQGAADKTKASLAAERIFELIDHESAIDPLSNKGIQH